MKKKAKKGNKVSVHYTGKLKNDTVFDSSKDKEPLAFTLGEKQMIPGFEKAVMGMAVDETKTITIPFDEAYGPYKDELNTEVNKDQLPDDLDPKEDEQLVLEDQNGNKIFVIVTEVTDTTITLDSNHPLAGEDLIFEITLVSIEK
jgi:peptidylprolyl isomerase